MVAGETAHQPAASNAGLGSRDTASAAKQPTGRQIARDETLLPYVTGIKNINQSYDVYNNNVTSQQKVVNDKKLQLDNKGVTVGDLRNQFRSGMPNVSQAEIRQHIIERTEK